MPQIHTVIVTQKLFDVLAMIPEGKQFYISQREVQVVRACAALRMDRGDGACEDTPPLPLARVPYLYMAPTLTLFA